MNQSPKPPEILPDMSFHVPDDVETVWLEALVLDGESAVSLRASDDRTYWYAYGSGPSSDSYDLVPGAHVVSWCPPFRGSVCAFSCRGSGTPPRLAVRFQTKDGLSEPKPIEPRWRSV